MVAVSVTPAFEVLANLRRLAPGAGRAVPSEYVASRQPAGLTIVWHAGSSKTVCCAQYVLDDLAQDGLLIWDASPGMVHRLRRFTLAPPANADL